MSDQPKVTERDREVAQRWMNEGSTRLQCEHEGTDYPECPECFQDLTLLLARHREEEREACAKAAENADIVEAKGDTYYAQLGDAYATRRGCASAIRARGESHD